MVSALLETLRPPSSNLFKFCAFHPLPLFCDVLVVRKLPQRLRPTSSSMPCALSMSSLCVPFRHHAQHGFCTIQTSLQAGCLLWNTKENWRCFQMQYPSIEDLIAIVPCHWHQGNSRPFVFATLPRTRPIPSNKCVGCDIGFPVRIGAIAPPQSILHFLPALNQALRNKTVHPTVPHSSNCACFD